MLGVKGVLLLETELGVEGGLLLLVVEVVKVDGGWVGRDAEEAAMDAEMEVEIEAEMDAEAAAERDPERETLGVTDEGDTVVMIVV